jgi:hypothetical protein
MRQDSNVQQRILFNSFFYIHNSTESLTPELAGREHTTSNQIVEGNYESCAISCSGSMSCEARRSLTRRLRNGNRACNA